MFASRLFPLKDPLFSPFLLHIPPWKGLRKAPFAFPIWEKNKRKKEVKQLSQAQPDWQQGEIEVGSWSDRIDQQINCLVGNQVDTNMHLFLLRLWRQTVSQFQPYFRHLCDLIKSLSVFGPQFPPLILRIVKVLTSQSCLIEETTYVEMPA